MPFFHIKGDTMSFITTYSNISMDPLTPDPKDIEIVDIAHALSLLCRANGHFPHFYSVGQHCINCANEAKARGFSERVQLACLLHDASEAFISDITRPVKKSLPTYLSIEKALQTVIYQKYLPSPLTEDELSKVAEIDDTLLYHEFWVISGRKVFDTVPQLQSSPQFNFVDFTITENEFLQLFHQLKTK